MQKLLLWAGAAHEEFDPGTLPFFPTETRAEARLSAQDVHRVFWEPSPLYAELSEALAGPVAGHYGIPPQAARVLTRDPAVLITHLFLDRAMRLGRLLKRHPADSLEIGRGDPGALPARLDKLRTQAASSQPFNQELLSIVGAPFGVATVDRKPASVAAAPARGKEAVNYNFSQPGLAQRILWKLGRRSSQWLGRVPALSMAYAEPQFLDAGLFAPFRLADLHESLPGVNPPDPALRESLIRAAASPCRGVFVKLLESWGVGSPAEREQAFQAFLGWLVKVYPSPLLEDIPVNFPYCLERLQGFKGRPLVFSEIGDTHTLFMAAAARALGMGTVGVQHAVHYGFVVVPAYTELEFAYCDRFVTWGWSDLPDRPLCGGVKPFPLPTPWLSERSREWREALRGRGPGEGKRCDLLLMTDKFQRFPPAIGTNRANRTDFLAELALDLKVLVEGLCGEGLKVLHKPFDDSSAAAVFRTIAGLKEAFPGRYELYEKLDKGLTPELLEQCGLVLWDEPGTGFFECLAAGIPAMLYWPRIYSKEETYAGPAFKRLEGAGLSCRSVPELLGLLRAFKAAPGEWMGDPSRQEAAASVLREYAWVDDDWARLWREFLRTL